MKNYIELIENTISELNKSDEAKELIISLVRKLNRLSGKGIAKLTKYQEYIDILQNARDVKSQITKLISDSNNNHIWSLTISGIEEYCEFEFLHAIINHKNLPSPSELGVPSWLWMSAVGDIIGELRRIMLHNLIEKNLVNAKDLLQKILFFQELLAGLDFSKNLIPNFRRKMDISRALTEKSQSDFANAIINKSS